MNVIYTDTDKDANARNDAAHFIHLDLSDHTQDESNADIVLNVLKSSGIQIDGCLTFNDDFVVLVALISTKLGLTGAGVEGAKITKSKHDTYAYLRQEPDILDTCHFVADSHRICNKNDILSVIQKIKLPAIIKTEYGSDAYGVSMVTNKEECLNVFEKLQCLYNSPAGRDPSIQYAFGTSHGRSVVLMEHIGGTEHDVNIIMFKGILIDAFITDNGPTRRIPFLRQPRRYQHVYQMRKKKN
ncbi:hypothetical protein KUTeg_020624 [Tegillarca granosa]|uniref:ATP-grasp domain-containing protein n=1 Tax=Tegillarca granosa TaxID=220873 RepID=A0ABQ9ECN7_TEGGR|nr:hypothetical protein KUTeg_020624 [Tegillarca granosa]